MTKTVHFHIHAIKTDRNEAAPARHNKVFIKRCCFVTLTLRNVTGVCEHCHKIHSKIFCRDISDLWRDVDIPYDVNRL